MLQGRAKRKDPAPHHSPRAWEVLLKATQDALVTASTTPLQLLQPGPAPKGTRTRARVIPELRNTITPARPCPWACPKPELLGASTLQPISSKERRGWLQVLLLDPRMLRPHPPPHTPTLSQCSGAGSAPLLGWELGTPSSVGSGSAPGLLIHTGLGAPAGNPGAPEATWMGGSSHPHQPKAKAPSPWAGMRRGKAQFWPIHPQHQIHPQRGLLPMGRSSGSGGRWAGLTLLFDSKQLITPLWSLFLHSQPKANLQHGCCQGNRLFALTDLV